jgi:hypothetical protein
MGYDLYRPDIMDDPRLLGAAKSFALPPSLAGEESIAELINQARRGMENSGLFFQFNQSIWPAILKIAYEHGWQPKHKFSYYMSNDGNRVDSEETESLANALEAALNFAREASSRGVRIMDKGLDLTNEWLQDKLIRFIEFCRGGEFEIH